MAGLRQKVVDLFPDTVIVASRVRLRYLVEN